MKNYISTDGATYAFADDGSQDEFIKPNMTQITDAELHAILHPAPSPEQLQAQFTADIQQRLDTFAQTRNYDNILSACTYATSTVPKFAAEGQYCVAVRDATWAAAYQILADVQAGTRPMPTGFADVEAALPALVWPA